MPFSAARQTANEGRQEKTMRRTNATGKKESKRVPYHFGKKLRMVREHKGMTLKVVADKAGVSESLVSQIERNKVSPAIDTLLALADALDINLEFLFEEHRRKRPVKITRSDERFRKIRSNTKSLRARTNRKKTINSKRTSYGCRLIRVRTAVRTDTSAGSWVSSPKGRLCSNMKKKNTT